MCKSVNAVALVEGAFAHETSIDISDAYMAKRLHGQIEMQHGVLIYKVSSGSRADHGCGDINILWALYLDFQDKMLLKYGA